MTQTGNPPVAGPVIRTPDQKLRVFISSTLKELLAERQSVRASTEHLHLAPVMFELGARPHPPRDLYRAYLDQSDIFVGIYAKSYGWVAPTEAVSGLEDEYLLSGSLPKLIYIKQIPGERDARLSDLLDRIRSDDSVSFKYFDDAAELRTLVEEDLATLLAERFVSTAVSPVAKSPESSYGAETFPAPPTELLGRETEAAAVRALLHEDSVRLVTLTGPGGIGKSRLAIEVGESLAAESAERSVYFVSLAPVTDTSVVAATIAQSIGVRDTGDDDIEVKLVRALRGRRVILVLDNFEQIIPAASLIARLLAALPELSILVTSRTLLRISGEHNFEVGPLQVTDGHTPVSVESARRSSAVMLFVARARAVKADFELTQANVEAVTRICAALDGVPLALELAAARIRILPPATMLARLDRRLPLLTGGLSDLPVRQQTLRNTIEWSTNLLGVDERNLLIKLGVFVGGFSLDAAEYVANARDAERGSGPEVLERLGTLVDSSLVRQEDRGERAYFTILATVREYALEELQASDQLDGLRDAHAAYYVRLGRRVKSELDGPQQVEWTASLNDDSENLRAAARYLIDAGRWDTAAHFAWSLYLYWWIRGHLGEVRGWMEETLAKSSGLSDLARAQALYFTSAIRFWQDPGDGVIIGLTESAELFEKEGEKSGEALALLSLALAVLARGDAERANAEIDSSVAAFREAGDRWGEAMGLVTSGLVAIVRQMVPRALDSFEESVALASRQGDELGEAIAIHHIAWSHLFMGEIARATGEFEAGLAASVRLRHDEGVAYGLEGLVASAAAVGDVERAGRLYGAALSLREQTGLFNAPSFSFHQQAVDLLRAGSSRQAFERARLEGERFSLDEVIAFALPGRVG